MSFSKMLEILQERNGKRMVLIKQGTFYIATGKDAVLLHGRLNLKCLKCKGIAGYKEDEYLIALCNFFEKLEKGSKAEDE